MPVAVLLVYGGTGIPGEVDPVASRQDAEQEIHFTTDPSIHAIAVSQAAGVIQGEPAVIPDAIAAANNGFAVDFYREVAAGDGNIFFSPTQHVCRVLRPVRGRQGEHCGSDAAGLRV